MDRRSARIPGEFGYEEMERRLLGYWATSCSIE